MKISTGSLFSGTVAGAVMFRVRHSVLLHFCCTPSSTGHEAPMRNHSMPHAPGF